MSLQGCLTRIKLYRERYENLSPEPKRKLKENFDKKINEEIQNLKETYNHEFSESDLNNIVVSI